ncbi:MAG: hypothetical protein LBT91_02950 [Bifidobacteriaceae bacterium]|jgi:hypothetical protein|nr:hypothetical protein [Bifidobacteriaceae bacterium]
MPNSLFDKGNYIIEDSLFLESGYKALKEIGLVQEVFAKNDTDTIINEIRDTIVSSALGFTQTNIDKHGFDAKNKCDEYIEIKATNSLQKPSGTFNDTNKEKCMAFMSNKVWLALAVWHNAADLVCIAYGNNPKIGEFLLKRMQDRPSGSRSTQTISFKNLVIKFSFSIGCFRNKYALTKSLLTKWDMQNCINDIKVLKKPFSFIE